MSYAFLARTYGVPSIKMGDRIFWKPKGWYGRVYREDRRRPKVLRVKFPGDRKRYVEVDPAEVVWNPEIG